MSKPLPTPPKQYDLVESFDALALAGKKTGTTEKKLPDLPGPSPDRQSTFVGGFSPELLALNAALDSHRRPPLVQPINQHARTRSPPEGKVSPEKHAAIRMPMPIPPVAKQSLTMQYALKSLRPTQNTPAKPATLAPPFVIVPPRPRSDPVVPPQEESKPPLSAVTRLAPSGVTPNRPRSVSVPLSPKSPSPGKNTAQCSGMTKAGKQCSRQVKLPATHSHLEPTPVLYCHQHKELMINAQTGFYVRKTASPDKFVEFSHYIPKYLQTDTQLALRVEMEKTTSPADVPGYIYTFEIRDPKRPDVILLKVGRAVNLTKRLDQWDKQCGSKVQIPRGWWPGVAQENGIGGSLLKGNIKAGDPGPFCHRVERLVHIELTDLSLHTPYLDPDWPRNASRRLSGVDVTNHSRKASVKETTCPDCGVIHKEIFAFPRPERGRYMGNEWELIVKPVIEKWGRFVQEYYS